MTITQAKYIGARQGLISVALGLVIAQIIMSRFSLKDNDVLSAVFWILDIDYLFNILIGVIILITCGYFFGHLAGKLILINGWNYAFTGIIIGLTVLVVSGFLAGIPGFSAEGIDNMGTYDNPFFDYLIKPLFWVTLFGFIPAIVIGVWFGWSIKKKGAQR